MMKLWSVLIAIAAVASAGIVEPVVPCGGDGTFLELRLTDCTDLPCVVVVEQPYELELDFTANANSDGLQMKFSMILPGVELVILETEISGQIEAGGSYTLLYTLVPQGILVGPTFDMELELTGDGGKELCIRAPVRVVPAP